jgi:hypothetical protein
MRATDAAPAATFADSPRCKRRRMKRRRRGSSRADFSRPEAAVPALDFYGKTAGAFQSDRAFRPTARCGPWPVAAIMPASAPQRRLRASASGPLIVAALALLLPPACAWPLFFNGSGTTQLSSAFGADVLLSPSTGAAARAAPHLRAAGAGGAPSRRTLGRGLTLPHRRRRRLRFHHRARGGQRRGAGYAGASRARTSRCVRRCADAACPHRTVTRACSWAARR